MRKELLVLICIFFSLNAYSQNNTSEYPYTVSDLTNATVNLRRVNDSTKKTESGSGIFVSNGSKMYILTAAHVAKFLDKKSYIILKGENDRPIKLFLFEITNDIKWVFHKTADLALIEIQPSDYYLKKYFTKRFFPIDGFLKDTIAISREKQLTVIGFPLGLGTKEYFSPLTYRSYSSSGLITLNRADTKTPQTFIILENSAIKGYSGAPVFDLAVQIVGNIEMGIGRGTKCVGLIHGNINDEVGGMLTAMTPAFYINEFFKKK
jgi:S1-C subfamily serine protease